MIYSINLFRITGQDYLFEQDYRLPSYFFLLLYPKINNKIEITITQNFSSTKDFVCLISL